MFLTFIAQFYTNIHNNQFNLVPIIKLYKKIAYIHCYLKYYA